MATFDLEPDDLAADDPGRHGEVFGGEVPDDGPTWGRKTADRLRAVPPRTWWSVSGIVAGTLALVGGGLLAAHLVTSHGREERLAAAPGGVLDVAAAMDQDAAWEVDADTGVLAVLAGGSVVVRDGADVLGVDAATGEERWRHTLGDLAECGPTPWSPAEWATPVDELVCLSGTDEDRTVTVFDAGGAVLGHRGLGDVAGAAVQAAADGMIVVVEPDGPVPAPRRFDSEQEAFDVVESGAFTGPGAVLRFEDALTGDVRSSVAAYFDPSASSLCLTWTDGTVELDFNSFSLVSSPGVVGFERCGVDVTWTPPVGALATSPRFGPAGDVTTVSSVDGGLAVIDADEVRTTLVDVDAHAADTEKTAPRVALDGLLLDPWATDGAIGPRVVAAESGIVALDPDDLAGDPRWERAWDWAHRAEPLRVRVHDVEVLVRTADVVLLRQYGELVGLDVTTGRELWRSRELVEDGGLWVAGAVTDGAEALLLTQGSDPASYELVRLDVANGEVLARARRDGSLDGSVGTVGGRMLLRTSPGDAGGGTDVEDGGTLVTRSPGSLRGSPLA